MTGLPSDAGYNGILVCVEKLTKLARLIPCLVGGGELSAEQTAKLFFDNIVRFYGVPSELVHDRDPRFTSNFWRALFDIMGSRLLFSSAYHPQTDGQTE